MTATLARRRRQRTLGAFTAGVIGLAVLPVLGLAAWRTLEDSKEGRDATAGLPDLTLLPPTPGALLGVVDEQGEVTAVALLALAPPRDGQVRGGTVIVVPAGSRVNLADGGVGRLADTYRSGGDEAFVEAAEGLLGVAVTSSFVGGESAVGAILQGYGPVEFLASSAVLDADPDGVEREVVPAGGAVLDGVGLASVLTARRPGDSEMTRLGAVGDLWSSIALRVGVGIGAPVTVPPPATAAPVDVVSPFASFATFSQAFFAGPIGVYRLSAEPVPAGADNPGGIDLIRLNLAQVNLVTATVMPDSVSPPYPSVTFYVRSPLNDPTMTLTAVARLLYGGANVVLVKEDASISAPARNTISFIEEADRDEAEKFAGYLGPDFAVVPADTRIDGVDVILTLGESFRAEVANPAPPQVTTTPVDPASEG